MNLLNKKYCDHRTPGSIAGIGGRATTEHQGERGSIWDSGGIVLEYGFDAALPPYDSLYASSDHFDCSIFMFRVEYPVTTTETCYRNNVSARRT